MEAGGAYLGASGRGSRRSSRSAPLPKPIQTLRAVTLLRLNHPIVGACECALQAGVTFFCVVGYVGLRNGECLCRGLHTHSPKGAPVSAHFGVQSGDRALGERGTTRLSEGPFHSNPLYLKDL